ncbi:LysR family transcriptional regulator [Gellertiella hungarica]|nr:LysR family transcriptional regulator [Gellertiella hungarica]
MKAIDDLSWDDVRLVRLVAESAGLAGAASLLGVDPSTVYRRLGALEKHLGCTLFERHRTGYVPTAIGEELVALADGFESGILEFGRRLKGKAIDITGEVRVATADSLLAHLLTPVFARFQASHPGIRLDVVIGNLPLNLSRRDADVAIRATDNPPDTLVGRRIGTLAWALYGQPPLSLAVADGSANWVTLGDEMASLNVVRWAHEEVPPERRVYRANSVLALASAVEAGIGVGHLPCFIGDQCRALVRLSDPVSAFSAGLWLLTHADLKQSPRIRLFMDFVAAELNRLRPLMEGDAFRLPAAHDGPEDLISPQA